MEASGTPYIVFCDLDHTLLRVNSGRVLALASRRHRILPVNIFFSAGFHAILHKLKLVSDERMIRKMGEWLQGLPVEKMDLFIEEIVQTDLLPAIRPQLVDELAKHRERGALIYILSSAMEEVCKPFVENLTLDGLICTHMERQGDSFTGKPIGTYCFGNEKLKEVLKLAENQHIDLAECWYYADDINDVPVFEVIGHPVCVNPGKSLARIAGQKGWPCFFY
jgi:HAD superfamily hydrolase (TIGR01490 family)